MTFVNDPFHQSCRAQISSSCFICSRVIIHKLVLEFFTVILYSWLRLSELAKPSMQPSVILLQKDNILPCRVLYYIMDFNTMDFINLGSQSDRSIIDYLIKSAHLIAFRMGWSFEVLTAFLYKQTSDQYYYGTVRRCIYTAEVQRCFSPELVVQSIWGEQLIVIHILIGIILIPIFCVHFTPYRNCEDAIFCKVDGV